MVGPSVAATHSRGFVCFYGRPCQLVLWSAGAVLAWLLIVAPSERLRAWWPFQQAHAAVSAAPCGR